MVFLVILDKNSQTGFTCLQWKNLWAESCSGWGQREHMGDCNTPILCNFLFVRHVFLKTKYCKSLASTSLLVLASFIICFCNLGGGISWTAENFEKFYHDPSSNQSVWINFENSLHPLMFGEVICRSGCIKGSKLPEKKAFFLHFSLSLAVTMLRRGMDIFFQFTNGSLPLSSEGGRILKFSSVTLSNGI